MEGEGKVDWFRGKAFSIPIDGQNYYYEVGRGSLGG